MTAEIETLLRVQKGLAYLAMGLTPFVTARMKDTFGERWLSYASRAQSVASGAALDGYGLLKTMIDRWRDVFEPSFPRSERNRVRNFVSTAFEARNDLSHRIAPLQDDEALRYLDAFHQLLRAVTAPAAETAELKLLYEVQRRSGVAPELHGQLRGDVAVGEARSFKSRKGSGGRSKGTTEIGYTNRNNQTVVRKTNLPGTDYNQMIYVLRCNAHEPPHEYGANGADIFQRRCPKCGGAPGLKF